METDPTFLPKVTESESNTDLDPLQIFKIKRKIQIPIVLQYYLSFSYQNIQIAKRYIFSSFFWPLTPDPQPWNLQ
jgi:hypothetical protein